MTNNFPLESADAIAIPVRLLSSVAVVGRDNEPIYLRGDLCDCNAIIASSSSSSSSPTAAASSPKAVTTQHTAADGASSSVNTDDEDGNDAKNDDGGEDNDDEGGGASPQSHGRRGGSGNNNGKGLFGRIKGVVGRNNNSNDAKEGSDVDEKVKASERQHPEEDTEEDDDDPFGFFENNTNSNNPQSSSSSSNNNDHNHSNIPAVMSLTQQLVLHASLDRFEEMASRSNKGGAVRWRTPGSNSANNAMWMGLLCEVEERWNVYGTCMLSAIVVIAAQCVRFCYNIMLSRVCAFDVMYLSMFQEVRNVFCPLIQNLFDVLYSLLLNFLHTHPQLFLMQCYIYFV